MRRRREDDGNFDVESGAVLPQEESKNTPSISSTGRRRKRSMPRFHCMPQRCRPTKTNYAVLLASVLVSLLLLFLHESFYFVVLNRIDLGQQRLESYRSKLVSPAATHAAIVSLHRGPKFWGYLGTWLEQSKKNYAMAHGYAYFNQQSFPKESNLQSLSDWQRLPRRKIMYDKTRYLLYVLESYRDSLTYVLWIDGDAVFANLDVAVEDRIEFIRRMYHNRKEEEVCLVWASDTMGANAGVLLLVNSPMTRQLLLDALHTYSAEENSVFDLWTDQASLKAAVHNNATYEQCTILLSSDKSSRWLQSRVRGTPKQIYQQNDWILHLPNHNRWELLQSLRQWLPQQRRREQNQNACHTLSPIALPNLDLLTDERRQRYESVRNAIKHAWTGYATTAALESLGSRIPPDDASPLSNTTKSWLHYGATLHDALDTLYLANLTSEYNQALSLIISSDLQTTSYHPTKTFEYSLRIMGGLLGAYSVSGDARLLTQAHHAADALLEGPFRSSPTVLPRMFDMLAPVKGFWSLWYRIYASIYRWGRDAFTKEHHYNSLAGVGSFIEFGYLSALTGDGRFRRAANAIFRHVAHHSNRQLYGKEVILPTFWNVMTGGSVNRGGELGSGADSFYEYLIKQPVLNGCPMTRDTQEAISTTCSENDRAMLTLYEKLVANKIRPRHALRIDSNASYPVDHGNQFHHLLCFVPAMLALGAGKVGYSNTSTANADMLLAKQLTEGCYRAYKSSITGLAPEQARVRDWQLKHDGAHKEYMLRPEFVESLFVLYRLTKDVRYQEMGWEVFQSLEAFCRVENGYAGLVNVHDPSQGRVDDTPSYFVAETLKYLLLLFGPDDYVSLDEFVLTTEGHPMRRAGSYVPPLCFPSNGSAVPLPRLLVAGFVAITVSVSAICFGCYRGILWVQGHDKSKSS